MKRKPDLAKSARRLVKVVIDAEQEGFGYSVIKLVEAVNEVQLALGIIPKCRSCKCSEQKACPGGCFWIAPNLCSKC